jgi:hypothetical protein
MINSMTTALKLVRSPNSEAELTGLHPANDDRCWPATVANVMTPFVAWLDRFGETSYDHQSLYAGPIGGRAKALYYRRPRLGTLVVAPVILCEAFLPSARRWFGRPSRFPIADAHYAMGFALLAEATGEARHLDRAVHFLEVLEATRSPGYRHWGWGYPFDWVTRNGVIRAGTPLVTSTPYVYEAFASVHRLDGAPRWRAAMAAIAAHVAEDIGDRSTGEDEAAAAYYPGETGCDVVNASAYRAFLLTRAAADFARDDFRRLADRNLAFVLAAQRPDGSWPYAVDEIRTFVDHYHTCFVLKALAKIEHVRGDDRCRAAIDRGLEYYVRHLFDEQGLPVPFAEAPRLTVYRRELYDYAECLNLGGLLHGRSPALAARAERALKDVLERWARPDGSFHSRELLLGWDTVPMHRWGQSQLFRILCLHLTEKNP